MLHGINDGTGQFTYREGLLGADWQVHAYGNTKHAFSDPRANNPEMGLVYNATADRRSGVALLNFLEEVLR